MTQGLITQRAGSSGETSGHKVTITDFAGVEQVGAVE
jgi:hypothetical protein